MKKKISFFLIVIVFMLAFIPEGINIPHGIVTEAEAATLRLNSTVTNVPIGMTRKLAVSGTSKPVYWSSSNKSVAPVSSSGAVTGKKIGTATISAKVSGKTLKCIITVINKNDPKQVAKAVEKIVKRYYKSAFLTTYSKKGNLVNVDIAKPQGDGLPGMTVTVDLRTGLATCDPYWDTFFPKVPRTFYVWKCQSGNIKVTQVKLNRSTASVVKGNTITLKATVSPSNATNKGITWKVGNTKTATVSSAGVVKGVGPGTTIVYAIAKDGSGKKATCKVTVKTGTQKTIPNVSDKILKMRASEAAKHLGLNQKKVRYEPEWEYTSYWYIRKGQKLGDKSPQMQFFQGDEKGIWNLYIQDGTISFQGIKIGMTVATVNSTLKKNGWTYDFQWKDSSTGEVEYYYNKNVLKGREITFCVTFKNGKLKKIAYDTEGD